MFTVVQDFLKRFFGYFWFQASSIFNAPFGKENQIFNFFKEISLVSLSMFLLFKWVEVKIMMNDVEIRKAKRMSNLLFISK